MHVIAALDEGDVPLADVADALGVLEKGGGHEGDVAEAGAADTADDGAVLAVAGIVAQRPL